MHRSGTSLCSHILSVLGVDMADELRKNPANAKGYWERWEIVELHDRILQTMHRDYFGPAHDLAFPPAWWAEPEIAAIKRELIAFLHRRMGEGYFGFKDPRTMRLMPVWHEIFQELKLVPKIVLCLRNPGAVAKSLHARDQLAPEIGEYRWVSHMVDFFRYTGNFDVCTVEYENWFSNPMANAERLCQFLELSWQQSREDLELTVSGIVDPALRHDVPDDDGPRQPLARSLYAIARRHLLENAPRDEINDYIARFTGFQRLWQPLEDDFDTLARAVRQAVNGAPDASYTDVAALGEALRQLRQAQHERSEQIATLQNALERRDREQQAFVVEAESLLRQLGQAQDAMHALERRDQEQQVFAVEAESLRQQLRQAQDAMHALEIASIERDEQINRLTAALRQHDHEGQEYARERDAFAVELASLRQQLEETQEALQTAQIAANEHEERIKELETALEQAEADRDRLRDELATTRRVSGQLITAFHAESVVRMPNSSEPRKD